eukprot:TRINITY_DN19329_c0_g1_i1.p1 TRINITY_DN19329_c0_g1~~TRINITY_DN19329_c0_g1_i1.p1  ORF type:complete len:126 (+),score=14.02 TRINITY_DN19329_c0_g1_i1:38-379(+)
MGRGMMRIAWQYCLGNITRYEAESRLINGWKLNELLDGVKRHTYVDNSFSKQRAAAAMCDHADGVYLKVKGKAPTHRVEPAPILIFPRKKNFTKMRDLPPDTRYQPNPTPTEN